MIGCLMLSQSLWSAFARADQNSAVPNVSAPSPQTVPVPAPWAGVGGGWNEWLPPRAALGSLELGPLTLRPTLNLQLDGFSEVNNGWGGHYDPPLQDSEQFFEQSNEEGLNARLDFKHYGELSGRISGIFDMIGGGLNAAGTNHGEIQNDNYSIEDAYLKWTSGEMFPGLGYDALQIVGGRYTYRIGDGFLFYNGASGGGNRVTPWMAPHHAFRQSGVVRLASHGAVVEGFYLSPNDHPGTSTRLAGVNLEYRLTELLGTGFTFANIFHSQTPARQGLNVIYWRGEGSPLARLKDFYLSWSVALESNGNREADALGWYVSPSYTFSTVRWQPTLYYRYASFSGGGAAGNREFDPLFYGMSDWGTWYQGEILGNWISSNSNLNSHQARLSLSVNDMFNVNLIYYHFLLDSQHVSGSMAPLTSKDLADEVDLDLDFVITDWWTMVIMVGTNVPGTAAKEINGGGQTWIQTGIWSSWSF